MGRKQRGKWRQRNFHGESYHGQGTPVPSTVQAQPAEKTIPRVPTQPTRPEQSASGLNPDVFQHDLLLLVKQLDSSIQSLQLLRADQIQALAILILANSDNETGVQIMKFLSQWPAYERVQEGTALVKVMSTLIREVKMLQSKIARNATR